MGFGKDDFYHTGLQVSRSDLLTIMSGFGFGNHYYVDYATGVDTNDGKSWKTPFKTYGAAVNAVTSNNNDVIHINGNSTVVETSMVTLSENRVHTIGHCGVLRHMLNGAKIKIGVTTAATDIATIKNTGVRNTFTGIRVMNENTKAESLYAFAEGGEATVFNFCDFYKSTHLDSATAAELLMNGDTTQLYNCTIGSSANITGGIRANMLLTAVLSGKKARDVYLENCKFLSKADDTDKVMVYGANATDVERMLHMKGCSFINNPLSAGTPAHAVGFGAAQTQGGVLLENCTSMDCTIMAQAAVGIYVAGAVPTFATTGVSVAS